MSIHNIPIGIDVLTAAQERIAWTFDNFPRICVSFSGGKDSSVMMHLAGDEARKRGVKIGCLFIDLEGQYKLTIDHVLEIYREYDDVVDPYWVCLPLALRNAVSVYEPKWLCWDPDRVDDWIRQPPKCAIVDEDRWPWFERGMEFEEFVPLFGEWYAQGDLCAAMVGIRTDESLNRWRTIKSGNKKTLDGKQWTTWMGKTVFNVYPIYDWRTRDIWIYNGRTGSTYNGLYNRMHRAGLTIHQQRICQPYGDDQRKGLWLFHVIEPETWSRIVARVNGANSGSLYARDSGNITGVRKITLPDGHTWKSFAEMLLGSMPPATKEHYENKIAVFLKWWLTKGVTPIPDEASLADEAAKKVPSWRRICKCLLRNDYWCKGLSFTQTKAASYERYKDLMRRRREEWRLAY